MSNSMALSEEDREQIKQARIHTPDVPYADLSMHERDRYHLLAIIDRLFPTESGAAAANKPKANGASK